MMGRFVYHIFASFLSRFLRVPQNELDAFLEKNKRYFTLLWDDPGRRKGLRCLACVLIFFALFVLYPSLVIELQNNSLADSPALYMMLQHHWVAYDPSEFNPDTNPSPSKESIMRDLRAIQAAGFNGIVTFGSKGTLAEIPRLAKKENLAVIMGVWNPNDPVEIQRAIDQREFVDAYCVGHNNFNKRIRYSLDQLAHAIKLIKLRTQRYVTTSEEVGYYKETNSLCDLGDWMFPDVHISLMDTEYDEDVQATLERIEEAVKLARKAGRPLMLKCLTFPWKGLTKSSKSKQRDFFRTILQRLRSPEKGPSLSGLAIVAHSAFDSPWKQPPFYVWDPYTGLLEPDGSPRPAVEEIINWRP